MSALMIKTTVLMFLLMVPVICLSPRQKAEAQQGTTALRHAIALADSGEIEARTKLKQLLEEGEPPKATDLAVIDLAITGTCLIPTEDPT
jgi:hypothetical protein